MPFFSESTSRYFLTLEIFGGDQLLLISYGELEMGEGHSYSPFLLYDFLDRTIFQ